MRDTTSRDSAIYSNRLPTVPFAFEKLVRRIKYLISLRRMVSGCIRKQSMHFGRITVPRAIGALALLFWHFSSWRLSSHIFDAVQERSTACMEVDEGLNTVFKCKTLFPRRTAGHDCRQAHTLDRLRGHRGI